MFPEDRIRNLVQFLYPQQAGPVLERLRALLANFSRQHPDLIDKPFRRQLSQQDAILITYGDQFQAAGQPPLESLRRFLETYLHDSITGAHILPFFPYSSDDGFSVIDYRQVDPSLGSWENIDRLKGSFFLMFDAVINHISRHSAWFQRFLAGDPHAQDDFIVVSPEADLSQVVRPRTLPLLTPINTPQGKVLVWTTFSDDQIDLNYANPDVLLAIVDLILFYTARGASLIRLDAIAYLWKEPGTSCIHLPQTHAVVTLLRAVLDEVAPGVLLITETNVPHAENISYFGEVLPGGRGTDEAQMVYAFPLAPLVLHTFHSGSARALSNWIASLEPLPTGAAFFNFLASHDGIGVRPAEGLLPPDQIQALVDATIAHGGEVSYKTNADGSRSPYELNITWYDALNDPNHPDQDVDVRRFLASQAIMLSLSGVPGIYAHSLFGSRNCHTCYQDSGRARSLNREKFQLPSLEMELGQSSSITAQVFSGYRRLLQVRKEQAAFHPAARQQVLAVGDGLFALLRTPSGSGEPLICLVDVSGRPQAFRIDLAAAGLPPGEWVELLAGQVLPPSSSRLEVSLPPYGVAWLQPRKE